MTRRGLSVGVGVAVAVKVGDGSGVGVDVGDCVAVGLAVGVAVGVAVEVGFREIVGDGVTRAICAVELQAVKSALSPDSRMNARRESARSESISPMEQGAF
jgi:hypothetical protein